eukprot:gnl/TRDRNA2_/TRDRNA2_203695_c0_seq1.p1 gnl/TRDRNA2_/TRDRNA2_203695_c0~~gnl/TRDRNA2_/TRDRNA2_203695_c0_seq1.p1  ORF type:complete len:217 (-),score=43.31 gnl/TRDRNA2_/TRDRNA2_203695_c0_seq1:411-1061(-)
MRQTTDADQGAQTTALPVAKGDVLIKTLEANLRNLLDSSPPRLRVVFLDVDGVLALRDGSCREVGPGEVEPSCARLLIDLLARAGGARVVLSSTWRYKICAKIRLLGALVRLGADRHVLVGQTPDCNPFDRPGEIRQWLADHAAEIQAVCTDFLYCVIDDWDLLQLDESIAPVFVRTDPQVGLCRTDFKKALAILDPEAAAEYATSTSLSKICCVS